MGLAVDRNPGFGEGLGLKASLARPPENISLSRKLDWDFDVVQHRPNLLEIEQ